MFHFTLYSFVHFQFLNKNIGFRAICSSTFNAVNAGGSSSNRINITTNWPPAYSRCQQNAPTVFHNRFLPQIDSFRSLSSNVVVASRVRSPSSLLDKFKKMIGLHKDSKSVNNTISHWLAVPRIYRFIHFCTEFAPSWLLAV